MMMEINLALFLALLNLFVCSGLGYVCACRLNVMEGPRTRALFRAKYAALLVGATASGWSPVLFNEWPGVAQLLLAAAFLFHVAGGASAWRDGVPEYAQAAHRS